MTEHTAPKIYEKMMKFVQTKEDPKTHNNPLHLCKCSSHLKSKMKEPNWLSNLAKEIEKKQEIKTGNKVEIKLNPQNRDPRIKFT